MDETCSISEGRMVYRKLNIGPAYNVSEAATWSVSFKRDVEISDGNRVSTNNNHHNLSNESESSFSTDKETRKR
jgi:hypothetical protein